MLAIAAAITFAVYAAGVALGLPTSGGDRMTATLQHLGSYDPLARGFEFVLGMTAYLGWKRGLAPLRLSRSAWTAIETAALGLMALWLALAVL